MQFPVSFLQSAGGIADDIREPLSNKSGLSKHFDIFSNPFRLTPYRSTVTEQNVTSAASLGLNHPRNFQLGKDGKMYALGDNGAGLAQVLQKSDPTTGNWAISTTAVGTGTVVYGSFIEWAGAFWMFTGANLVSKWTIASTFTDTVATIGTIASVAQSVVGADDNMYMFYNNRVVKVSNAGAVLDNYLLNL